MTAAPTGRPAALVLAAGAGTRFGMPKALIEIDGDTFVDRAVRILRDGGCDPIVVVLGAQAADVRRMTRLENAVVVDNPDWASGMASSLRRGLAELTRLGAPAVVVALVDQPWVGVDAVRRLAARWSQGARAVVATYDGTPRNPVLLDASVWDEVAELAVGDIGARAWLRQHADEVERVACEDVGSADDVDEPDDLDPIAE